MKITKTGLTLLYTVLLIVLVSIVGLCSYRVGKQNRIQTPVEQATDADDIADVADYTALLGELENYLAKKYPTPLARESASRKLVSIHKDETLKNDGKIENLARAYPDFFQEFFSRCLKRAKTGDVIAQYNLGIYYGFGGFCVKPDGKEAFKWYSKAAEQGHVKAQFILGNGYIHGSWGGKDVSQAFKWYRKAAEQGYAEALYMLGMCYAKGGDGITKDISEAIKWYHKAAEQGNAYAQYALGECYKNGDGVPRDMQKAIMWYRQAAKHGHFDARLKVHEFDREY